MNIIREQAAESAPDPCPSRPAKVGLADALQSHTRPLHLEAERSGIVGDVLRGRADRAAYALFLRNLLPAYRSLERGLDERRDCQAIRAVARPEVYRSAAIRADLEALAGPDWETSLAVLPSAARYADRISAIAVGVGRETLLVAHAYVRYLGDLNGGRIIKRVLGRTLHLGPECLAFYDFPGIVDLAAFTRVYRSAFDDVERHIAPIEPVFDEADAAFRFNIEVSTEVRRATA